MVMSIAIQPNGEILIGSDRLVAYDGDNWTTIPVRNSEIHGGMNTDEGGNIWLGGYGTFGYLERSHSRNLVPFQDLLSELGNTRESVLHPYKLHVLKDRKYLVTKDRVIVWDGMAIKVHAFDPELRIFSYILGDRLFLSDGKTGLYVFENNAPKLIIPNSELDDDGAYWGVSLGHNKYILGSLDHFFFVTDDVIRRRIKSEDYSSLRNSGIVEAVLINNEYIVISTWTSGLAVFSLDGRLIRMLDEEAGLPVQNFTTLKKDGHSGLWAGTGEDCFISVSSVKAGCMTQGMD